MLFKQKNMYEEKLRNYFDENIMMNELLPHTYADVIIFQQLNMKISYKTNLIVTDKITFIASTSQLFTLINLIQIVITYKYKNYVWNNIFGENKIRSR